MNSLVRKKKTPDNAIEERNEAMNTVEQKVNPRCSETQPRMSLLTDERENEPSYRVLLLDEVQGHAIRWYSPKRKKPIAGGNVDSASAYDDSI